MSKSRIFVSFVASVVLCGAAAADGYEYEPVGKGFAPPPGLIYSGVIEGAGGWAWAKCDRDSDNTGDCNGALDDRNSPLVTGSGRASVPLGLNTSIQFDIDGLATFTDRCDGCGANNLQSYFLMGSHLAWRNPDKYALGVFGLGGSSKGGDDDNALIGLLGGEGQWYWNNLTLYGQAGYFWANDESNDDVMTDAWFVRGVMRYFFGPNQRLQGELSYADGEENVGPFDDPANQLEALSWDVRYDHTFHSKPIGWFVGYHGTRIWETDSDPEDRPFDNTLTEHTVLLGLRFQFGATTMLENDRRGVTFDMPDVGRWAGYTTDVVD